MSQFDERDATASGGLENDEQADRRDVHRAAETVEGQLLARDVRVRGDESPAELADLLTSVQRFEATRSALGADSYQNALDSSTPDDPALVLPTRWDDESVAVYRARIEAATARLRQRG